MKIIAVIIMTIATALLVGCADELDLGPPPTPQHFVKKAPSTRAAQLYRLNNYRILGAFSVAVKGDTHIINFNWYHSAVNNYILRLTTPGDFYQVVLRDRDSRLTYWRDPTHPVRVRSLRNFMLTEMGWYIPLNDFYYWLRGVALKGSGKAVTQYDQYGHLITLRQDGWNLQYQRYIQYGAYDLPTMIQVQSPHGDYVRIAIKEWLLANGSFGSVNQHISRQDRRLLKSLD